MTESRLYGATIAFECSKMKAKILELSKMALFQVDTYFHCQWNLFVLQELAFVHEPENCKRAQ